MSQDKEKQLQKTIPSTLFKKSWKIMLENRSNKQLRNSSYNYSVYELLLSNSIIQFWCNIYESKIGSNPISEMKSYFF